MEVFAKIVETGSFSAAARQLRLSQAAASKHVQVLEEWLGARLLNRTTRRLSLTDFGVGFHQRCTRILEDVDEARQAAGEWRTVPKGVLRVTAPAAFSRHLEPMLSDFSRRYPEVGLEIDRVRFLSSHPNSYPYREVTYPVLDIVFTADALRPEEAKSLDAVAGIEWKLPADIDPAELAFPSMRATLAAIRGA